MTPDQARAARAMLNLDMKSVCKLAKVGKRTLAEFENGRRSINDTTRTNIKAFYISCGIEFSDAAAGREGVFLNKFCPDDSRNVDRVSLKCEISDLLGAREIMNSLRGIEIYVNKISNEISFSRKLLIEYLFRSKMSQKEFSSYVGCSSSFISAIMVGKKIITPSVAEKMGELCVNIEVDIKRAVLCERKIKSNISNISKLSVEVREELSNIYFSNGFQATDT